MKNNKTLYLWGILFTIILGTWLYVKVCCCPSEIIKAEVVGFPFQVAGDDFSFASSNGFNFMTGNDNFATPVNDSVDLGVKNIKVFLSNHPNQILEITGYYIALENNNTSFKNLGIARSEAVKHYFVDKGIPAKQISTKGELKDRLPDKNGLKINPLSMLLTKSMSKDSSFFHTQLTFYFQPSSSDIKLDSNNLSSIKSLRSFLSRKSYVKAYITGYSDNTGTNAVNLVISRQRAFAAKKWLMANGVQSDKMERLQKVRQSLLLITALL